LGLSPRTRLLRPPRDCLRSVPPLRARISPCGFQVLSSLALSRLMNGVTVVSRPRFPAPRRRYRSTRTCPKAAFQGQMCVSRHKWRVLCYSSLRSPLFSSGRQGFILRSVTKPHRPCLISTSRESATPCPSPLRVLLIERGFLTPSGSFRCQSSRASLGKTYRLPRYRPASHRFGLPDIRPRLATSAQPPPQRHIAGSLFATYPGSTSYFLQTRHL
jgi:hypothetical protein